MILLDTLQKKPEVGILSAIVSTLLDSQHVWQFIGIVLGVLIAVVTLILKLIELKEKIQKKRSQSKHPGSVKD